MWAQTGKRSINRHVFCCILTMMVKTYLLVRVVPNHSSKGSGWCVLGKDGSAEAMSESSEPDPQSTQTRAGSECWMWPLHPCPLGPAKKKTLPALLTCTQSLQSACCQRQILGELDLFVPAHQRSLLPKAHVPTLPWRATIHPCNSWVKTRGTKWLGSDQPVRSRTRNTINPVLVPAVPALIVSWRHYCAPKWLGSKHKTLYCYSQIHTSNTRSSFLWQPWKPRTLKKAQEDGSMESMSQGRWAHVPVWKRRTYWQKKNY